MDDSLVISLFFVVLDKEARNNTKKHLVLKVLVSTVQRYIKLVAVWDVNWLFYPIRYDEAVDGLTSITVRPIDKEIRI